MKKASIATAASIFALLALLYSGKNEISSDDIRAVAQAAEKAGKALCSSLPSGCTDSRITHETKPGQVLLEVTGPVPDSLQREINGQIVEGLGDYLNRGGRVIVRYRDRDGRPVRTSTLAAPGAMSGQNDASADASAPSPFRFRQVISGKTPAKEDD